MRRLALAFFLCASPAAAQMCICLKCASGNFQSYTLPSGSMKPTIEPGQCAIFNKTTPPRDIPVGSVTVYVNPTTGYDFVGRLIATEGQNVQIISGRVFIDGAAVATTRTADYVETFEREGPNGFLPRCPTPTGIGQTCNIHRYTETLGGQSFDVLDLGSGQSLDDTPGFLVPEGHVFMMGDHRDNSVDSRMAPALGGPGFIPYENIVGVLDNIR